MSAVTPGRFHCGQEGEWVDGGLVNDTIPDCRSGRDEPLFSGGSINERSPSLPTLLCVEKGQLPCVVGQPHCFNIHHLCVYDTDTITGALLYCRNGRHLSQCRHIGCPTRYKCPHSYCIPLSRVCDGVHDCPGLEDESHCQPEETVYTCPGYNRCKGGACLDQTQVCDGHFDCSHGDDEHLCNHAPCPDGCECFPLVAICTSISSTLGVSSMLSLRGFTSVSVESGITEIPAFLHTTALRALSLSNNLLAYIKPFAFRDMPNLYMLKMSNNTLPELADLVLSGLGNLRHLDLSSNPKLRSINERSLIGLYKLQHLDLSNTAIKHLPPQTFSDCRSLHSLDVHSTALQTLNLSFIHVSQNHFLVNISDLVNLTRIVDVSAVLAAQVDLSIITDNGYVNCLLGIETKDSHITKWCGSSYGSSQSEFSLAQQLLTVVILVVVLVLKWIRSHKNLLLFFSLIGLQVADIIIVVHALMTIAKDYIFDPSAIHYKFQNKFFYGNFAAALQLASILVTLMLVPCSAYATKLGMSLSLEFGKKQLGVVASIVVAVIVLLCTGSVVYGVLLCSLTDACTYVIAGDVIPSVIIAVAQLSILVTIVLYAQAKAEVDKSASAIHSVGGTRTGRIMKGSIIVKMFFCYAFVPLITLFFLSVLDLVVMCGVTPTPSVQLALSIHLLPMLATLNNINYLIIRLKEKIEA